MNKIHYKTLILGILLLALVSCQPDKPVKKMEFPMDEFKISSTVDTTIFGEQGTRVFIPSESFQFPNGEIVKGPITVQIKEFYKKSDIVLADLSTVSNGIMLETGGMLHIKALSDGKEVEIRSGKSIVVHFPKNSGDNKDMKLFYADETSTETSVTNWNMMDTTNLVKRALTLISFSWTHPAFNDETDFKFIPKNYVDTGYYWNPLDFYIRSYNFSEETITEIEKTKNKSVAYEGFDVWDDYGVECEIRVSEQGFVHYVKVTTDLSSKAKSEMVQLLKGLPQVEPGKNKNGDIIERKCYVFMQSAGAVPVYKTNEEYVKSFDAKYSKFENSPIKNMDAAEANYYIFSVGKLGWINCDAFFDVKNKVDLVVNTKASPDVSLKLVFSDINGVMMPEIRDGKYLFNQVPVGRKATLVGTKNTNDKLLAAMEEITISENPIQGLKFSEITLGELRKKLDEM